jgi:fido (protein-threonine AMPylation protein)
MDGKRSNSIKGERYAQNRSEEATHLTDLLSDFGCTHLNIIEIQRVLSFRYGALDHLESHLPNSVQQWVFLSKTIHSFLYADLMTFAGKFRQYEDPNHGVVEFGGQDHRSIRSRFRGVSPMLIEQELEKIFEVFFVEKNPTIASIRFYLDWSWVHPFYDANGRIGRVLVYLYLAQFGLQIEWASIDKQHGKFMKKLNGCHTLRNGDSNIFENRFSLLIDFWKPFVQSIPQDENYT